MIVKVKSHKRKGKIVKSHSRNTSKFTTSKNANFNKDAHLKAAEKAHKKALTLPEPKAGKYFAKADYHRKEAKRVID